MKELSIEEKAKAYDEAIKRAKDMLNYKEVRQEDMEYLFPELKESDDDRMLREIKRYIKEQGDKPTGLPNGTVAVSDMIAWLEKQGEHANFRNKIQVGDRVTRNEDGVLVNLSQLNRIAKPTDKVEPKLHEGEWITIK